MQRDTHRRAQSTLKEIDRNPENYLIVHYSCESFYGDLNGRTPRITSIAIYSLATAQTVSFSIHKTAERMQIDLCNIEEKYDQIEKSMLTDYFDYIRGNSTSKWIHWNMRDINYGFQAIEHRFEVLGGDTARIEDSRKIDLARLLKQYYGYGYAQHPRIDNILKKNDIEAKDYLSGSEEARAFDEKDFIRLHQSTLRKVALFSCILERAVGGSLKVDSKWHERRGLTPQGFFEFIQGTWWTNLILFLITMIAGAVIGGLFTKFFL